MLTFEKFLWCCFFIGCCSYAIGVLVFIQPGYFLNPFHFHEMGFDKQLTQTTQLPMLLLSKYPLSSYRVLF